MAIRCVPSVLLLTSVPRKDERFMHFKLFGKIKKGSNCLHELGFKLKPNNSLPIISCTLIKYINYEKNTFSFTNSLIFDS
jgi:hypothetical protein